MIKIFVENKEIYIRKGTSIQLEVNNSVFSVGSTDGEIVFTFSIPAEINDLIFKHARFVYVQRMEKFNCRIEVSGHEIANGDLYIQTSDESSYSVGVVVNPFPDKFQSKSLNENDFGEKITISESVHEHNSKWKEFLQDSLDPDSNIKFPLFLNPKFYGDSNPDFGYYQLIGPGYISGYPDASLTGIKIDPDHKFVNRLFFDDNGDVIEEIQNSKGIRIFNKQGSNNMNSFTFCPAFRVIYILESIFKTAGYTLTGSFKTDPFAVKNFMQSLRAMDGNKLQYDVYKTFKKITFNTPTYFSHDNFPHTIVNNVDICMKFEVDGNTYETFANTNTQIGVSGVLKIKTYIPDTVLKFDDVNNILYRFAFLIVNAEEGLPDFCWRNGNQAAYQGAGTLFPTNKGGFIKIFGDGTVGNSFGYNGSDYYELSIPFNNFSSVQAGPIVSRKYKFILAKIGLQVDPNNSNQQYFQIVSWEKFVPNTDFELSFYNHNIFAKEFNIADFMPNITNLDFINEVCKMFGVAQYIDSTKKVIEFSFIRDILKSKKVLDISEYCINVIPKIGEDVKKQYSISFGTESDQTLPDGFIDPVEKFTDIPQAKLHIGKFCYVRKYNSIYQSIAIKNEDGVILSYKWEWFSGNISKKIIGENENTDITSVFKIGYQKEGIKTINTPIFPVIDHIGYSPVLHSENQTSDFPAFILTNYGNERLYYSKFGNYVNKEKFRVICPEDASNYGLDLTVNTEKSIGNVLISPWLNFISNYETVNHKFALPVTTFLNVLKTLKPQDKPISEQERFLMVNNIKLLPIKMKFTFTIGSIYVIADIDFAKEKITL